MRTRAGLRALAVLAGLGAGGAVVGSVLHGLAGRQMAPWILGRASGIAAYLLLVLLVLSGLVLSHPWRSRVSRPATGTRIRSHATLALVTLGCTVLRVVVLATDSYAGVGWWGALVPMGASYRPAATTLGVLAVDAGLIVGVSAALAGRLRLAGRVWRPVHRAAVLVLVAVWSHGVLAGSDAFALRGLYLATGAIVVVVALSRHVARVPAEQAR